MSMEMIDKLYVAYGDALTAEYDKRMAAEDARGDMEAFKAYALSLAEKDGTISGKNKDTREQQRAAVLAGDKDYAAEMERVAKFDCEAKQAEIKRKVVEAQIGLTKAFWYSQSGKL